MLRFFLYIAEDGTTFQNGLYDHLLKTSDNFTELYSLGIELGKNNKGMAYFIQDLYNLHIYGVSGGYRQNNGEIPPSDVIFDNTYRYLITFSSAEYEETWSHIHPFAAVVGCGAYKRSYSNYSNYILSNEKPISNEEAINLFRDLYKNNLEIIKEFEFLLSEKEDHQVDIYDSKNDNIYQFRCEDSLSLEDDHVCKYRTKALLL